MIEVVVPVEDVVAVVVWEVVVVEVAVWVPLPLLAQLSLMQHYWSWLNLSWAWFRDWTGSHWDRIRGRN